MEYGIGQPIDALPQIEDIQVIEGFLSFLRVLKIFELLKLLKKNLNYIFLTTYF